MDCPHKACRDAHVHEDRLACRSFAACCIPSLLHPKRDRHKIPKMGCMQIASTSRDAPARSSPRGAPPPEPCMERSAPPRPRSPPRNSSMNPQYIALKEGEPVPAGYSHMVLDRGSAARAQAAPANPVCVPGELCTPPRSGDQRREDQLETAPISTAAKKNMARTMNRKANASFAREMKDSLAAGLPPTRHVPEGQGDLKARWHAAAKDLAYKMLDLRKDGWKDYSIFDKGRLHAELDARYKFDPPLEHKRVEKYLSGHLRTSRAVWKAHWLKYGDLQRHHNCPPEAWAKLTKWWPTEKCKEAAADMAARRARVQGNGRTGRTSMVDRLTAEVSRNSHTLYGHGQSPLDSVLVTSFFEFGPEQYSMQIPHTH